MSDDLDSDLALALALCDRADAITTEHFGAGDLHVETKPDLTPVSEADRAVEEAVRERLAAERPDDAILGEEFGTSGEGLRRWVIDPIDGTKSYVRGVPVWATLLALEAGGEPVLGVVSAPALGRRWWARQGGGAFANHERIHVSDVHDLADAHVCMPSDREFEARGLADVHRTLTRAAWRPTGFPDFWGHMLVAEGAADVMVEPILALWDVAALRPIVEEAGGRLTDPSGNGWHDGAPCITTNGHLHERVLEIVHDGTGTPS